MIPKPVIHPLALMHLAELRQLGVEPTLEESLWLARLAERVADPFRDERLDLAGIPAQCGGSGVFLWRITIGAAVWYADLACAWWEGETERLFWALAWALGNARDREAFCVRARTRSAAEAEIREWSLSLSCTRGELEEAVDRVLPETRRRSARDKEDVKPVDWVWIIRRMEAATGLPADHWLWETSREQTLRAWEASRSVEAALRGECEGPGESAVDQALKDLAAAKAEIAAARREVTA